MGTHIHILKADIIKW